MSKIAVVFYSPDENANEIAYEEAKKRKADVFQVVEARRLTDDEIPVKGYKMAKELAEPKISANLPSFGKYDTVIIVFPLWDGYPAPAFNTVISSLPLGKDVEVILVSETENSELSDEKIVKTIERHGLNLISYKDIKQNSNSSD